MVSRFRLWLHDIPIKDTVERQMAFLVQVLLFGFMGIIFLAGMLNLIIPTAVAWQAILIRSVIFLFVVGIPLFLLRRGYFRGSVLVIIAIFFVLETFAAFTANLRNIAETLSFFTLAIILSGLIVGRRALALTFFLSAATVLLAAVREQNAAPGGDGIVIAGNFLLLNGLIALFVDRYGESYRAALRESRKREEELKTEIESRKQAEAEREKLISELATTNAELERFTYTASHDLRNPLVTIKGFLGMLREDLQAQRSEKVETDLKRIESAADKMNELLSDLLELSRIGRIINPPEEVDLTVLVREAVEMLEGRIRATRATVRIMPGLPVVHGDRVRLREVFENLIDNAAKYSAGQAVPLVEIGVREGEDGPILYVRDNGLGIEPRYHSKIFSLFEKLNPEIEGTGIGLALVKRIIETHGGKIWVESEGPGKGSTFCFTIPTSSPGRSSQ